ncbi:TRAP transporter permease [Pseudalkalibacillus sp. R45]|uniref:TRAP transporter permease n=1 Tax=Pseudalkalibacillus sp. R45 TaxID=3457433 RepID=UPI003FCEA7DD
MKIFLQPAPIIGIAWSLFHVYTAAFGAYPALVQRAIHIGFALALTFMIFRITKDGSKILLRSLDYFFAILSLTIAGYLFFHADRLSTRIWFVDKITEADLVFGLALIILVLEASRRTVGRAMTILASIFLVYGLFADHLKGILANRGLSLEHLVDLQVLSPQGIFGIPVGVSADYVFYFILFGAFLEVSGGGKLFNDLAFRLTGKYKGGPAKAAIVSSGLMGSISGSAVANVVGTGIFTIPLMKKIGYSSRFSAAVEAVASTGGQLMPPIMGAAAFVMAEMLGMPYATIILAAIIPSILFYIAAFFMVHLKASQDGIEGINEGALPDVKQAVKQRIHLLIPLGILVFYVLSGYSLLTAAFRAIVATILLSFLRKVTRMKLKDILQALETGAKQSLQVAIPCAIAGIIIGVISYSGLGLKFTGLIINLSFGNLIGALILVAIGCIILGMGMPTTSAYIMGAILMAPALVQLGIEPLAAHMYVLYFSVLSVITPPVALASYSAAGIAGSDLSTTGWTSILIASSSFLIPFAFVINPAMLLIGSLSNIVLVTIISIIGIFALSAGVIGYVFTNTSIFERIFLIITAILLIIPELITSLIGLGMFAVLLLLQKQRAKLSLDTIPHQRVGL